MRRASFALFAAIGLAGSASAADAVRPNVLLIYVDNVGYGDLGCYGNRVAKTPHIDRLATEGVRCTDFYVGSPSCSPSRGSILTGRHPERNGLNHQLLPVENAGGVGLPHAEKLIPHYLKPLGYATGCFGKWNVGFGPGSRPTERGFDEYLGHISGNIHYDKHLYHGKNDLRRGIEPVDLRGQYSTDLFADAAIDFIRRHRAQPWFAYVPFNAVHFVSAVNVEPGEKPTWPAPAKFLALFGAKPGETDERIRFQAVLAALDDAVGRLLATVDNLELRDRTLVLCLSDNGAFMTPGRGKEEQSNAPLRDGGVTTWEGGVRVPAVVRWPGRLPAGRVCREMLSTLDVLPLIVAAAGGKLPTERVFDGGDPLPALAGTGPSPHRELHWVWRQGPDERWQALRSGSWKLIRKRPTDPWQLYDLATDVGESKNLADAHPDRVRDLAAKFAAWETDVKRDASPRATE